MRLHNHCHYQISNSLFRVIQPVKMEGVVGTNGAKSNSCLWEQECAVRPVTFWQIKDGITQVGDGVSL